MSSPTYVGDLTIVLENLTNFLHRQRHGHWRDPNRRRRGWPAVTLVMSTARDADGSELAHGIQELLRPLSHLGCCELCHDLHAPGQIGCLWAVDNGTDRVLQLF